jgi:CBS domain-containing protein/mannitol/fructose-specific phosphotransferase system IIA component (Ntr-type)
MDLLDLLPAEHVLVPLEAANLRAAVHTLVRRLEATGAVRPSDTLHQRIAAEGLRDVIGLGDNVTLPHYRTDAVDGLTLALGVSRTPLGGDAAGEAGPRVVAVILAPHETASLYLQTTSTLARLFRRREFVEELLRQPDAEHVRGLPALQGLRIQPSLVVRDVMTHRIVSVPPDATVRRTLDLMLRRRLGAVPVVGDKGEVLGIITDADIMRALLPLIPRAGSDETEASEAPQEQSVKEIMTRSVLCVSEDMGVRELASMMINKDVEQLPVVNAGSIAGMVFREDIIRKLFGRA